MSSNDSYQPPPPPQSPLRNTTSSSGSAALSSSSSGLFQGLTIASSPRSPSTSTFDHPNASSSSNPQPPQPPPPHPSPRTALPDLEKTPIVSNRQPSIGSTGASSDTTANASLVPPPLTLPNSLQQAPVTDKLLGLLSSASASANAEEEEVSPPTTTIHDTTTTTIPTSTTTTTTEPAISTPQPQAESPQQQQPEAATTTTSSSSYSLLGGWWGSSSNTTATAPTSQRPPEAAENHKNKTTTTPPPAAAAVADDSRATNQMGHDPKDDNNKPERSLELAPSDEQAPQAPPPQKVVEPIPQQAEDTPETITSPEQVPNQQPQQQEEHHETDDHHNNNNHNTDRTTTTELVEENTTTATTVSGGRKPMTATDQQALEEAFDEVVEGAGSQPPPAAVHQQSGTATSNSSDKDDDDDGQSTAVTERMSNVHSHQTETMEEEKDQSDQAPSHRTTTTSRAAPSTTTTVTSTTPSPSSVALASSRFTSLSNAATASLAPHLLRGLGQVHAATPIPQSDVCLRVLRKFRRKTAARVPTTYGGTKPVGWWQTGYAWFAATHKPDPTYVPYQVLVNILDQNTNGTTTTTTTNETAATSSAEPLQDDSEGSATSVLVNHVLGESGDTMDRARQAMAAFVFCASSWAHASAHEYAATESHNAPTRLAFGECVVAALDTASTLMAHGCLDRVQLVIGQSDNHGEQGETVPVTHLLTQSILAADLTLERTELAAMKFVLTAGCRTVAPLSPPATTQDQPHDDQDDNDHNDTTTVVVTESLLSGAHLLQTVRMLYHIFLTTESTANKTTARASLQQLVTHVFGRMVAVDRTIVQQQQQQAHEASHPQVPFTPKGATPSPSRVASSSTPNTSSSSHNGWEGFPSEHHRNAFLILRAICKLSMRSLPDAASGMHAHIGFQSSGSHETWDGHQAGVTATGSTDSTDPASPTMTTTGAAGTDVDHSSSTHAQLIYTAAIHPALESKILALDLMHHVLTHTDFPPGFVQRSGPQFQACLRNYLCVSLLKNCTSSDTTVVHWSLRIFVPTVRNFRTVLKTEIEAFVTNVFFVILDSKHSTSDHKGIVVRTFEEICSDPVTLAEIFLNYDCDLSAVDLFHRIVQTLSRVSRTGLLASESSALSMSGSSANGVGPLSLSGLMIMGGSSSTAARMEKIRFETRELRLDAMKALRQVLASLHASIVEPMASSSSSTEANTTTPQKAPQGYQDQDVGGTPVIPEVGSAASTDSTSPDGSTVARNPVEVYGSKKKRRAEESEAILRFNQKPSAGLAFAAKCGHLNGEDPSDVARYLLNLKNVLDKTMIGEYLGREAEYQNGFSIQVLHEYVRLLDFTGLLFDEAIRYFLSGFRLPGEAQKIDRIMEKFAERFTEQNPGVFPTPDVAFILSFSIIMLNTDLHNPAIKEERRMTRAGFIRNNSGICDGQDLPEDLLNSIFDRIKANPISLKEDDEARERAGESKNSGRSTLQSAMNPASFFTSHYEEMDRARETNFRKERDHIVRTTESLLKRRRQQGQPDGTPTGKTPKSSKAKNSNRSGHQQHQRFVRTEDSGLRDEYVAPMFEVAWGPALAAFSTAMESANGTMGSLLAIATDEELEIAAENAAETIEVCLTGFRFAICTGGLCGNDVARDSFMLALSRFTQLGSGALLEPRHVRCCQTMLSLAREDGELLGSSWQHVFRALSEVNRFHQLFHLMARNDRAAAAAADRRRKRLEEREHRRRVRREKEHRRQSADEPTPEFDESGQSAESSQQKKSQQQAEWDLTSTSEDVSEVDSLAESDLFSDDDDFELEDDMDAKAIDEANARLIYEGISEDVIEVIYERSSSLSTPAIKEFVLQLCYVSSMEISVGYGSKDLNHVSYRQQHALLAGSSSHGGADSQFHHSQPNIYNLQKLVEVAHYNMESRPRLVFAELWSTIAEHLTQTSLHKNPALAMYAVDSFRQLSIQFLKRDELEAFEFQRRFLKPLETVMAQSKQSSTKELLLNCVARVIQVFDVPADATSVNNTKGGLRSGWVPLLVILGLGCRDHDLHIAKMSQDILMSQISQCMKSPNQQSTTTSVLLTEHFPEAVDAVFMCVNGPHTELSMEAIEVCSSLAHYLVDENAETPHVKQRVIGAPSAGDVDGSTSSIAIPAATQDLELWWPLLLGISRASGEDDRPEEFRIQALNALFGIINQEFFTAAEVEDRIQRLQLVFRGILTPMLEFAEVGSGEYPPYLPKDFERFLSASGSTVDSQGDVQGSSGWLDTMFDPFIDSSIALCKRSIDECQTTALVEEVFAILNHCLVSDSGSLAVRGVARLEQFVTSDLDPTLVTDNVWATVCHMLSRCLVVRGLPRRRTSSESDKTDQEDYEMEVREFVAEESMLPDRRYVGGNVVMVIGNLLSSDRTSNAMGFRWRLFLMEGLAAGIVAWEEAASLLLGGQPRKRGDSVVGPPDYLETAQYGRTWMNGFLFQLASMEEVVLAGNANDKEEEPNKHKLYLNAQKLVVKETEQLLKRVVETELALGASSNSSKQTATFHKNLAHLATELIRGYSKLDHEHIVQHMTWLNPVLLNSCSSSKDQELLKVVQTFVQLVETPIGALKEDGEEKEKDAAVPASEDSSSPTTPQEEEQEQQLSSVDEPADDANKTTDAETEPREEPSESTSVVEHDSGDQGRSEPQGRPWDEPSQPPPLGNNNDDDTAGAKEEEQLPSSTTTSTQEEEGKPLSADI